MKKAVKAIAKKVAKTARKPRRTVPLPRDVVGTLSDPSTRDLAWYHEWAVNHRSQSDIARDASVSKQAVHQVIKRVELWIRGHLFDDILIVRNRHQATLENVAAEALKAWSRSIGQHSITTTKEVNNEKETTTRVEMVNGDPQYLQATMKALSDIRVMIGADKPQKVEFSGDGDGLERVAGVNRAEALRRQAELLLQAADGAGGAKPEGIPSQ